MEQWWLCRPNTPTWSRPLEADPSQSPDHRNLPKDLVPGHLEIQRNENQRRSLMQSGWSDQRKSRTANEATSEMRGTSERDRTTRGTRKMTQTVRNTTSRLQPSRKKTTIDTNNRANVAGTKVLDIRRRETSRGCRATLEEFPMIGIKKSWININLLKRVKMRVIGTGDRLLKRAKTMGLNISHLVIEARMMSTGTSHLVKRILKMMLIDTGHLVKRHRWQIQAIWG